MRAGTVVHSCGAGVYDSPAPPPPKTPRERYRLLHRLRRIARRLDESRGTVMNMTWIHWSGEFYKVHEALGFPEDDLDNHGGLS